jgi:hypothetical protein
MQAKCLGRYLGVEMPLTDTEVRKAKAQDEVYICLQILSVSVFEKTEILWPFNPICPKPAYQHSLTNRIYSTSNWTLVVPT